MAKSKRGTAHLPKYEPQKWDYYSPGVTNPTELTREDLVKVINKAAKAANQRLRSLEKQGLEKQSGGYRYARGQFKGLKPRFKERLKPDTDITTLRHEYMQLREFIGMKTSTVTGVKMAEAKGFETAVERGFEGTAEQWKNNVEKYFGVVQEGLLSSDVVYSALTSNDTDVIDEQIRYWQEQGRTPTGGESLVDYLRRLGI